jgi:FlaA1/EpsC-like NDP-sugar epimerase
VLGRGDQMAQLAAETGAQAVIVAITAVSASTMRRIIKDADTAGISVKVLPPLSQLVGGQVHVADIRDIDLEDLLGRHEIDINVEEIAGYLSGRTVLVTGAGGSIGSELCRQIARFGPKRLYLLDRDESALHALELMLYGRALMTHETSVLADIRDAVRIRQVFEDVRPDVVFHAAALKHLPVLERHPEEAVKSNVWGTWNVLEAAVATGVSRFVNISTDKAADPISILGYSKRVAERLTSYVAVHEDRAFLSVRFGNVLGSRGSVVTTFQDQISRGAPITVTDPRVTRYFMTVQEACQLVIQAAARGHRGDTLVLDMGEPVSIEEVARTLAVHAGRPAVIAYSGLRRGEKLNEALFAESEQPRPGGHPLVSAVDVPPLSPAAVLALGSDGDYRAALERLSGWPSDGSELAVSRDLSSYETPPTAPRGENEAGA